MSSLQEIKTRISSVETTKKITKAMQLVATAKLRRAKANLDIINEYYNAIEDTFNDLFHLDVDFNEVFPQSPQSKDLYIVITSDLGLCGAYNSNIYKLVNKYVKSNDELIVVGTKGSTRFKDDKRMILDFHHVGDKIDYSIPSKISKEAIAKFFTGEIRSINILHTEFINSVTFEPKLSKVLPFDVDEMEPTNNNKQSTSVEFEPNPKEVVRNAIPLYVSAHIFESIVESKVSEMTSRRTAMENASDNADDLIDNLELKYNRARQAKITQEISEIIAGSEE